MKSRNLKLACLLLETVGIAALFLPFYNGFSPYSILVEIHPGGWELGLFWAYALPGFMAPFVCLQSLRSLFPQPLTKPEIWLCAALVGLLMLIPLVTVVTIHSEPSAAEQILLGLLIGLALFAAGLLITLKHRGVSAQFLAPLALRCAYIPHAVFCLLEFSQWGQEWHHLQVGAACVGATVMLYLVEIVHLTRQGLKHRPTMVP